MKTKQKKYFFISKSGVLQFEPDKNNGGILKFKSSIEDTVETLRVIAKQEPSQVHHPYSKNNRGLKKIPWTSNSQAWHG